MVSAIGYVRSRNRPGQEWRQELAPWTFAVNTISVVIVHTALAFLGTYVLFAVLSLALVGFSVLPLFGTIMTALSLGMTAYLVFPSVARMNTQRSSSLLMTFVVLGTTTSAVTTSDASWWKLDFSELGAHNDLSSWIFNGTLIAGGLLVTTFAVYISHDMYALVATGRLADSSSPRTVAASFITMGVMLAGVGIFPVDDFFWIHTFAASGMGVVYLVLLIGGRRHLSGMPRTVFRVLVAFPCHDACIGSPLPHPRLLADDPRGHRLRGDLWLDRRVHPVPRRGWGRRTVGVTTTSWPTVLAIRRGSATARGSGS